MNTNDNKQITTEKFLFLLKQHIDFLESQMAERCGMKLYKSADGFTQEEIYEYAGANDCVATLTLNQESAKLYGESLTVVFVYYPKERIALEKDRTALNDISNVKAKELLGKLDGSLYDQLLKNGIPAKDIVEMLVGPDSEENNTYASPLLRKPKVLEIPIEGEDNGKDIYFMYGALCHFIADGIGLTPEEHNEYLAYKIVLEREKLTDKEREEIFDKNGAIVNQEVGYFWLLWKKEAGKLTEKNKTDLMHLSQNRIANRFSLADKELQNMGLSFEKLAKTYPGKAALLFSKIVNFHEYRYTPSDESNEKKYEIDFLTIKNKKICPIEVKSSSYTSHKSFDYFVKKYQLKMQDRYIIYTKDLMQKDNILYIPIYMTMLV